jgi:hypothetical protein
MSQPGAERCYLNATWTNLYCNAQFAGQTFDSEKLQRELDALPRDGKYFTIVQFDEGVKYHRLPPDTLVFGCCAGDVPIPLVYESAFFRDCTPRAYDGRVVLACFVGNFNTHPIRRAMVEEIQALSLRKPPFYFIVDGTDKYDLYLQSMDWARFCLAPRGFGRQSFRFYEALKLGCVPVYVWDDIEWLPFREIIDYNKLCISIHSSKLGSLDERLRAVTREEWQAMRHYYESVKHLFTLEGICTYLNALSRSEMPPATPSAAAKALLF